MNIAILGGGHGCYAAAADLAEAGHHVRLWRRDAAALQPVVATGSIVVKDAKGTREVPIALATADIALAMKDAALIVVPSPATAQVDIARAMAPNLTGSQIVFLVPGTFGSYAMAQIVRGLGNAADVAWAETGTLPYLARKHGVREVNITVRAVRLPTGVYPARLASGALATIRQAYPSVHGCGDAHWYGPGRPGRRAEQHIPADDLRHRRGRKDPDSGAGNVDGYRPDHVPLPMAPV